MLVIVGAFILFYILWYLKNKNIEQIKKLNDQFINDFNTIKEDQQKILQDMQVCSSYFKNFCLALDQTLTENSNKKKKNKKSKKIFSVTKINNQNSKEQNQND